MAGGLLANWKTVPNLLSALRIIMVPIFIVLFYKEHLGWAVFVLFLSGLSDSLDGKIARRFNQISDLGKILDPLADKLTQISIAVMLFIFFRSSSVTEMVWFSRIFIVFLAKEALMVIISVIMLCLGLRPGAAEIYGKVATFVFYGVMLLIIGFGPEIGAFSEHFTLPTLLMQILVVISALLTIIAFFSYVPDTVRQFRERSAKKNQGVNK
jgi:cardiolipin synthase